MKKKKVIATGIYHHISLNSFSSLVHLFSLITVKKSRMKKELVQWKEPAYLSFLTVYLFHGKLIFSISCYGKLCGLDCQASFCFCQAQSLSFKTWLCGPLLYRPSTEVIYIIQCCFYCDHLPHSVFSLSFLCCLSMNYKGSSVSCPV